MDRITYSKLTNEAEKYWEWANDNPIVPVPKSVAKEGAGSEMRTPIMHYGVVMPVYLSVARYLSSIKIEKGMRLIELGSGSGRPLTYLKTLFPELEIWGVDYSAGGIKYAQQTYGKQGVKFKHVPAQDTSLKTGYFDFVISSHVIEHVSKEEGFAFIKEAHRLLKKGGYAFIGTPERRKCQDLYAKNPSESHKYRLVPPHEHEYTLEELWALGETVFDKKKVRVDALVNPAFYKVFKSSIDKFKPTGSLPRKAVNLTYRALRDKAPRPFFDTITRVGAKSQMRKFGIDFEDILKDNRVASADSSSIPENLLLVCQK